MSPDRKKKNRRFRGQSRTLGLLLLAGLFALNTLVALLSLSQKRYDVSVGQTATETIYATRAIEDTEATEALRQAARDAVQTVYALDKSLAESLEEGVRSFFTALASLRAEAAGIRAASAPVDASGNALTDSRSWQVVIAQDQLLSMLAKLPMPLTDAALGYALLSASDEELLRLEDIVVSKLSVQLSKGVSEDGVAAVRSEASRELQVTTLSTWLKELGDLLYGQYLQPTLLEDETATARAREEAAAAVTPVNIARGAAIVREGDTVSSGQMATLTALGLVRGVNENKLFPAGVAGCLLVAYALFAWYLYIRLPELLGPNKQMFMLLLIVGISVLLEWLCFLLEPRVTPAILAVLLTAVLLSREAAQAVNLLLAVAFGIMAGGNGSGLLGSASSLSIMASLLGGQAAIQVAVGNDRRGSLIAAGAACGGVGALVVLSGCAMLGESFNNTLVHTGLVLLPPVVLSVFCVGMLSVWENVFDVVTSARLHELLNGNHPLLRKMMTVAPGTFHHSMMAASWPRAQPRPLAPMRCWLAQVRHTMTWENCAGPLTFPRTRRTGTSTTPCRPRRARHSSLRTSAMRSHCCKNIGSPRPCAPLPQSTMARRSWPIFTSKPDRRRATGAWKRARSAIRGRARPRARARSSCWRIAARQRCGPWATRRASRLPKWFTRSSAASWTTGSLPTAPSPCRSWHGWKRASL